MLACVGLHMKVFGGAPPYRRCSLARCLEARIRSGRCGRRQVALGLLLLLLWLWLLGISTASRQEGVSACPCGALGGAS